MSKRKHEDDHYKCILCTRYFFSSYSEKEFNEHLKSHFNRNDDFSCKDCGQKFSSAFLLHEHIRNHMNDILTNVSKTKSLQCNVCFKTFKYESELKAHKKCLKTFKHESELKAHKKGYKINEEKEDMMKIKRDLNRDESSHVVESTDDFNIIPTESIKEEIYDEETAQETIWINFTPQDIKVEDPYNIVVKEENFCT